MMSFTDAVKVCLTQKFSETSGRATRAEFWWFQLYVVLSPFGIMFLGALLADMIHSGAIAVVFQIVSCIISIVNIIPNLHVLVRRLHDIGKSGWWLFLIPIPIGVLILWIFCCLPSTNDNKYGLKPLKKPSSFPDQQYASSENRIKTTDVNL